MEVYTNWGWATHQPLIRLVLSTYNPKLILELGMGYNSTPLFLAHEPETLFCIDNDKEWIDALRQKCEFKETDSVIFHDLGSSIKSDTSVYTISDEQKCMFFDYYLQLRNRVQEIDGTPKLLFVDNYTCLRSLAINALGESFDIIVFHDCQPTGVTWYKYKFDRMFKENFNSVVLMSSNIWTGCFIRKTLFFDIEVLKEQIRPFIFDFCKANKVRSAMSLEKGEF